MIIKVNRRPADLLGASKHGGWAGGAAVPGSEA